MKQFLACVLLGLMVASLADARPPRGSRWRGQHRGKFSGGRGHPLIKTCQIDDDVIADCGEGHTCSAGPVTLSYDGSDFSVTMCRQEGQDNGLDITSVLVSYTHIDHLHITSQYYVL